MRHGFGSCKKDVRDLRFAMRKRPTPGSKRKAKAKQDLLSIERGAKRAEQKAAGALDGRFRTKKVESKKRYTRKRRTGANEDPSTI